LTSTFLSQNFKALFAVKEFVVVVVVVGIIMRKSSWRRYSNSSKRSNNARKRRHLHDGNGLSIKLSISQENDNEKTT
jgi:hypothetical protein